MEAGLKQVGTRVTCECRLEANEFRRQAGKGGWNVPVAQEKDADPVGRRQTDANEQKMNTRSSAETDKGGHNDAERLCKEMWQIGKMQEKQLCAPCSNRGSRMQERVK